jgi:23S rRNA (uracil1939-C5)-methyltransferase
MEHIIVIKKVIAGGKGLGTLPDGLVVMVPGVLPGETVLIRESKAYRGHKEGALIRILDPAVERITPPCPYYGSCGGCDLQHAAYPAQLHIKQQILRENLERAHLELPEDQPGSTLASPDPFGYRHRLRLHLDRTGNLGFHQHASNQVVPIRRCLLATEAINRVIGNLVDSGWPDRLKDRFAALELIHCPESDRVILVLQPLAASAIAVDAPFIDQLRNLADAVVIQEKKIGRDKGRKNRPVELSQQFTLREHKYRLSWDQGCFFQVNANQNLQMIHQALGLVAQQSMPFAALDLFCGMGNFSIPLGLMGAEVTGIEHNRRSIHWAERNSREACLPKARFIATDVEQHLNNLVTRNEHFDCILLDPPRQGLGKASALLPLLRPRQIISISCDPATLARDLRLITAGGYRLSQITPVDMFPQTHHIESIALLERN